MKSEEAQVTLEALKQFLIGKLFIDWEQVKALDMAIEALKVSEIPTGSDLISREDVLNMIIVAGECEPDLGYTHLHDVIESIPSAEPKTETVLCALADRACPFQGKEYAWCLTCPHISEEDRALVKKTVAEPKTGEWNRLSHDTFHCNLCGRTFIVIQGEDAMNYCPNCGADMRGEEE